MSVINIVIIVIIILVLLWALNNVFFKTNIIYDVICDADKATMTDTAFTAATVTNSNIIVAKDIPDNNSSNFMLSVWFYIDNWGNKIGNIKNILYMATANTASYPPGLADALSSGISVSVTPPDPTPPITYKNIAISLATYENDLYIDIETARSSTTTTATSGTTQATPGTTQATLGSSKYTRYKLSNIPIQKWNNLTISVDSRTLDVYLDGKLRNSFILNGLYKNYDSTAAAVNKKNIDIGTTNTPSNTVTGNGFEGFITRIRYESFAINPQEAYNIYKAGINSSLANSIYNRYRLKVSFLEYNKERGSITI